MIKFPNFTFPPINLWIMPSTAHKTDCSRCKYRGTHQGDWCYMHESKVDYCKDFKEGN